MSSNLSNSATLTANPTFRGLVAATLREHAITALQDRTGDLQAMWLRHNLAQAVIHDTAAHVEKFAGVVADDAQVSATADPAAVDPARLRTVIASVWVSVAASTPGVG